MQQCLLYCESQAYLNFDICHINLECDCMLKAQHKELILVTLLGLRVLEGCQVGCKDLQSAYQSLDNLDS